MGVGGWVGGWVGGVVCVCSPWPRVARLPWLSSEVMSEIFRTFSHWFNAIEHSNMLQGWYEQFQLEQDSSTQGIKVQKSLSYAAHRFDSASKPFASCILSFAAVVLTAVKAYNERKQNPAGQAAIKFLRFISGPQGCERLVLAGMLCDAADEALLLTRAMDRESTDISLVDAEVQTFLRNIKVLFAEQQCVDTGFTKHMLEQVKVQVLWFDEHCPQTIGCTTGVRPAQLASCLQHMAAWVSLASKVVCTEFPSFDLIRAFRVLALSGVDPEGGDRQEHSRKRAQQHAEDRAGNSVASGTGSAVLSVHAFFPRGPSRSTSAPVQHVGHDVISIWLLM